jgi:two-component system KDP operon response regulator KdpE
MKKLLSRRLPLQNKKILIVEDDPDVRLGMQLRLEANHYDTLVAGDVDSAVLEAQQHAPDLILLDLGIPGGGGFAAMEHIRANPSLVVIPIVIVSGRTGPENRTRALNAGAKACLEKPVEDDELLAVVGQALGTRRSP